MTQQFFATESGERLDIFLAAAMHVTRTQAKKYIDEGRVTVNQGRPKKAGDMLRAGDAVVVTPGETAAAVDGDEELADDSGLLSQIHVLVEDPQYVVIDKPAGLLVHETQAKEPVTLAGWLRKKYSNIQSVGDAPERPGIVHRLDRAASGALVVAKTQGMFTTLKHQFQERTVKKMYTVLVYGTIEADHGVIDFPIDRGRDGRMVSRPRRKEVSLKSVRKMQPGKSALSEFWVQERYQHYTLLTVQIHTGRTHQIRVHMQAYGHPVVGDTLYVNTDLVREESQVLGRLFLHASELSFLNMQGERVVAEAPLPAALSSFLASIS